MMMQNICIYFIHEILNVMAQFKKMYKKTTCAVYFFLNFTINLRA